MKSFRKEIWVSFVALLIEVVGGGLLLFAFSPKNIIPRDELSLKSIILPI